MIDGGVAVKFDNIAQLASDLGCEVHFNEPMKDHTRFKVGGNAKLFIEVLNTTALSELYKSISKISLPVKVIGNGSNIIVSDKGIDCIVLHLSGEFNNINLINNTMIESGASVKLSKLCDTALENSLSGLEFAFGIPGLVGGAVYMNAGAYGGEMKDIVESCTCIDELGNEHTLSNSQLDFSYRHSVFSNKNYIITKVRFNLAVGDKADIKLKMNEFLDRRKSKQPLNYPSAGSTFKRPTGYFAGTLIEECGLKGKSIGGAMVSEKHAGFIINKDNATADDIINLIKFVQDTVLKEKGVKLECEVKRWDK